MRREPGVVDVDDTVDEDQTKYIFDVDKQKAALNGISTDEIARTVGLALGSQAAGAAQIPHERAPVRIALWFPRAERSSTIDLARIYAKGRGRQPGSLVGVGRLANTDRGQDHLSPPASACGVRPGRDGRPAAGGNHSRPHRRRGSRPPASVRGHAGAATSLGCAHDVSQGRRHSLAGPERSDGALVGRRRNVHHDPPVPRSCSRHVRRFDRHLHRPDEPNRLLPLAAHHHARHSRSW